MKGCFTVNKPITLLVVDDQPLVRKGITMCLARQKNMKVVGEVSDARDAVAKAQELRPDVVLMDIAMPHMDGLAITQALRRELPDTKVLILSIHASPDYMCQAIQAGALGYLLKNTTVEDLIRAIEAVARGESHFNPEIVRQALDQVIHADKGGAIGTRLTEREREVLVQIAEGWSNKEIAAKLGVSVRTVESHREHLMHKLNIHTAAGLARYAVAKGYVQEDDGGYGDDCMAFSPGGTQRAPPGPPNIRPAGPG